jgi:hypothetical protein
MRRYPLTRLLVAIFLVVFAGNTFPKSTEATVSSMWIDQVCAGDGTVSARLTWGPVDVYAVDQWLDLAWEDSLTRAGFRQRSQSFSAGANSIEWQGLTPNVTYYARVTQGYAPNLISVSRIFTFKTAPCNSTQRGEIIGVRMPASTKDTSTPPKPPSMQASEQSEDMPEPEDSPEPTAPQHCDRVSYPDVCIPPAPPYLTCSDIPDRNFAVRRPDPHNFDADRNGIGCEEVRGPSLGR